MGGHIGFIGLGRMGRPMATNLLRKGFALIVHDIVPESVSVLVRHGAKAASSAAELARSSEIVFTVLPTHVEVEQVLLGPEGVVASARPGTLVVEMSTIAPASTDRIAAALAEAGMRFVDAPIGRLASHADRGECLFMLGGSDADCDAIEPMLAAMGTDIHRCGPAGSGIRTKLVNNYLAITSCQMNAEALTLMQAFGLDLDRSLEVIHGTTATNGQLRMNYATKVLAGDVEPGFQIDLAHKDLSLALEAAGAERVPMTLGAAARESLNLARAGGFGGKDFSALLDVLCESCRAPPVRFTQKSMPER